MDKAGAPLPKGTRTEIRDIMQRAYFVIPDEGAIHQGKKRIENILNRLKNGKFAVTADYCEALSLATVASIAAQVPLALGLGEGAETTQPMGIASIGGLLISAILTMYLIPTFFWLPNALFTKVKKTVKKK